MRVGTDHEEAGECVVLEDDLMDDTGAWFPEADTVFSSSCFEELVYFFVEILVENEAYLFTVFSVST